MAKTQTTPILTLETITELPSVAIDGMHYPLLTIEAIPISAWDRLERMGRCFDQLYNKKGRSDQEDKELDQLADALCREVLKAPPEVHDRLKPGQKILVVMTFQMLPGSQAALRAAGSSAAKRSTAPPTGARSFRGSHDTTRASTRGPGLTTSRGASSRRT